MTTYNIFMHYYNDAIGKSVTNAVESKWYSCLTTPTQYDSKTSSTNTYLQLEDMNQGLLEQEKETLETLYIAPKGTSANESTQKYEEFIVKSATINNPKYDMIFVWDGLGYYSEDVSSGSRIPCQLYFDKMKRVNFKPWFFHSTYHSLKAAMNKAQQLIDLFGKDHIMIGKEVDLDQYIDIV